MFNFRSMLRLIDIFNDDIFNYNTKHLEMQWRINSCTTQTIYFFWRYVKNFKVTFSIISINIVWLYLEQ